MEEEWKVLRAVAGGMSRIPFGYICSVVGLLSLPYPSSALSCLVCAESESIPPHAFSR